MMRGMSGGGLLQRILGTLAPAERTERRDRLTLADQPDVVYAIGDVHGCLDLLRALEAKLFADATGSAGDALVVMLGDYVDRGPQSAQVLDHLIDPMPRGFRRLCLAGNHEVLMLDYLMRPRPDSTWLRVGGTETLASYGIAEGRLADLRGSRLAQALDSHVPTDHRAFLEGLPIAIRTPTHFFAHAGIRPGVPLEAQEDDDLIWWRDDYEASFEGCGAVVVHGHTPRVEPLVAPWRIGLDTGAFHTGRLSAVRLRKGEAPVIIAVDGHGGAQAGFAD